MPSMEIIEEFDVVAEDGRKFHIEVAVPLIDVRHSADPHAAPLRGELKTALTSEGYKCQPLNDDAWLIVDLGIRVKRIR
jgi:hypothetical protein